MRVTIAISLGCSLLLPVGTVNPVQTLKANDHELCHCTDDVTQHRKPRPNTEGHLMTWSIPLGICLS
jgi:hypothetical protein